MYEPGLGDKVPVEELIDLLSEVWSAAEDHGTVPVQPPQYDPRYKEIVYRLVRDSTL